MNSDRHKIKLVTRFCIQTSSLEKEIIFASLERTGIFWEAEKVRQSFGNVLPLGASRDEAVEEIVLTFDKLLDGFRAKLFHPAVRVGHWRAVVVP